MVDQYGTFYMFSHHLWSLKALTFWTETAVLVKWVYALRSFMLFISSVYFISTATARPQMLSLGSTYKVCHSLPPLVFYLPNTIFRISQVTSGKPAIYVLPWAVLPTYTKEYIKMNQDCSTQWDFTSWDQSARVNVPARLRSKSSGAYLKLQMNASRQHSVWIAKQECGTH